MLPCKHCNNSFWDASEWAWVFVGCVGGDVRWTQRKQSVKVSCRSARCIVGCLELITLRSLSLSVLMGCKNCWRHAAKLQESIIRCEYPIMWCGCLNGLSMETRHEDKPWLRSPQIYPALNNAVLSLVSSQTSMVSFHAWSTTGGFVFSFCLCRRPKPNACFSLIGSLPKPMSCPHAPDVPKGRQRHSKIPALPFLLCYFSFIYTIMSLL